MIEVLYDSLFTNYQNKMSGKTKHSDLFIDCIDRLHCNCHKTALNCGGSYIDSPKWLKSKRVVINTKNNNSKCFQYDVTVG